MPFPANLLTTTEKTKTKILKKEKKQPKKYTTNLGTQRNTNNEIIMQRYTST